MSATRTRVIAALVMAPFAIGAILLLPTSWLVMLAALVFLVGLWEWFKLAEIDDTLQRTVLLTANLLLMVLLVWASAGSLVLFQLATLAGIGFWLLALLWLRFFDFGAHEESSARMLKLAAGTLAIVPAWAALVLIHAGEPHGNRWLLTALAVVWAADTGAYYAGRAFGRRKLFPLISPKKTVAGGVGGLLAGIVAALVLNQFFPVPVNPLALLAAAALLVVVGIAGDLTESMIKRSVGVKDSGTILAGHGGILDRIDSLLLTAPVLYYLLHFGLLG